MNDQPPGDGPILHGEGVGWPPAPREEGRAPGWTNGRAFPAVWRDSLSFGMGALLAVSGKFPQVSEDFPHIRLGGPWNHRPPSHSEADIEQAVGAKIHVSHRLLPLLASAQLVVIEPEKVESIPKWATDDEQAAYSAEAKLPCSPVFLDFEAIDGSPTAWVQETWPLPLFLRGALCWQQEESLSIIPFGSVGSRHPWGGTDYQAWARWVYLQGHSENWPTLGPGDFITRANGEVRSWVDAEGESVCAHMGSVAYNLSRRALSVLMCLEAFNVDLIPEAPSRQVRRRAERKGERIGLIPKSWPIPMIDNDQEASTSHAAVAEPESYASEEECPIPRTHARLNQCHGMWHESLEAYADPDAFVGHLNALIQGLRSVTWVLQKELRNHDGFDDWYQGQQEIMRADLRMKWLVEARNKIEKQGDLDTCSVAHVRVIGGWLGGPVVELDVDATTEAHEIARKVQVPGLPTRTMHEGVLEVERRWTVEELAGDEILDVLAHCYGVLTKLLVSTHEQWGVKDKACVLGVDGVCEGASLNPHPSGRVPCMIASRKSRTVRRDLESGALVDVEMVSIDRPEMDPEELLKRYGPDFPLDERTEETGVFGAAEMFHKWGRHFFLTDKSLLTVVWLFMDGKPQGQIALEPEDQKEKYLSLERVAEEVDRQGANEIIFTTEVWEASSVEADDDRVNLRPGEREDKREALVTYALRRGGECRVWHSPIKRTDQKLQLGEITTHQDVPMFLVPIIKVWERWDRG